MKVILRKTILIFLFSLILWNGANFDFKKNDFSVLLAQPTRSELDDSGGSSLPQPTTASDCSTLKASWEAERDNVYKYEAYMACVKENESRSTEEKFSFWNFLTSENVSGMGKSAASATVNFFGAIMAAVYQIIVIPILSLGVKISGAFLDIAIKFTLNSKNISNVNSAIEASWRIVRDIINITFIFILLYTAIKTIIGSADAKTKKTLADVIIAAILINFSLFFTRILIDGGNLLATVFYNSIVGENSNISSVIGDILGIGLVFADTGVGCTFCSAFWIATLIQTMVMGCTIFVFSYVALLMLVRNTILIFLLAISPIGFLGGVVPKISDYTKKWRENLIGQVSVAPVFLFFIYLIVNIGKKFNDILSNKTPRDVGATAELLRQISQSEQDYFPLFKYLFIFILLIVCVKITKKMAGEVGGIMEKVGMMIAGAIIGYLTGGASVLLTSTLGQMGANRLKGEGGQALREKAAAGGKWARIQLAAAEKASTSSFDVRNVAGLKKINERIGGVTGLKMNLEGGMKPIEGGYAGIEKREQEAANKRYNELQASVTNKQRRAAGEAQKKIDDRIDEELNGKIIIDSTTGRPKIDPQTGEVEKTAGKNQEYTKLKDQKKKILDVSDNTEIILLDDKIEKLKKEQEARENALKNIENAKPSSTATDLEKYKYESDVVAAKTLLEAAKKEMTSFDKEKKAKVKELQEEIKKNRAGELAQIDDEIKAIKADTTKKIMDGELKDTTTGQPILGDDDEKALAAVNIAKSYAESIRRGDFGRGQWSEFSHITKTKRAERREEVAKKMQNQKEEKK